jgi:hypothetical protein
MRRASGPLLFAAVLLASTSGRLARAADLTDLASSFDEDNVFDFRFRVRYDHFEKRAQIKRELEGLSPSQQQILVFRDLLYAEHQDTLTLRAEVGLFQDLQLHLELPIILAQSEEYAFDRDAGSSCIFPPAMNPNCVNASNSSTIADGIVDALGYDAQRNGVHFAQPTDMLLQGPKRGATGGSGADAFDTFNVGLSWAPVAQRRDDTKPTWTIGIEGQFSIGNLKTFDRAHPNLNHGVSEGVHRLFARTAISHRFRYVDPYIGLWYMLPIARDDSLYKDYGAAQKTKNPQMQAGTVFGFEAIPWMRPSEGHKIAFDFRGRLEGHFNGRGYSEAWQLLASSPALACNVDFNQACDTTMTKNGYQNQPYTGITVIENYATLGADIALTVQIGKYVHFRTGFDYSHDNSHLISDDDIGTPLTASGRVMAPNEFNPAYRAVIDQPGRRYRVDNVNVYNGYIWGQVMF